MAKLIRFLSGRWTTRNARSTDVNSRGGVGGGGVGGRGATGVRPQRSRSADHHGLLMCKVALLDGTDVILDVPRRSLGSVLYEKVFNQLDLIETEYFGLQFTDELNIHCWLDSSKSIRRQIQQQKSTHGEQMYVFRFRVKFYSSDPNNLKEEITRYQFFLQLKSDVESGRLHCPKETVVDLAGLVLQAELGDFDESQHTLGLVSEFKFVPNQTEEMEIAVLKKFKTYRGLTPSRCELIYLNKAKSLELYGVDFNIVRGKDENQYQLGLMPAGILVCERSQKIGLFCWPKITKLQFKKKRLHLEVVESDDRGQEQEHTFIFRLESEKACKVLWRCAVEHHTFFRLSSPIKPYGLKSDFFRLGSRVRYSGSTELQTVSRAVHYRDIKFQRRLSKRYSRREKFDRQEKEESNNHRENNLYAPTKRWSVAGTQDSRRKSRDLSSTETNQTITRATDARSSMPRRRSRNYSSGRSPARVIDSDNNNVAKAAVNPPSLVTVQVTVSTQESFDEDFEQRTINGSSSVRKSQRGGGSVASKERLLSPQQSTAASASASPVSPPLRPSMSSSAGISINDRPRQHSIPGADAGHRSRPQSGSEAINRPSRQSVALIADKRQQTMNQNNGNRRQHQPTIDSMPLISYNSLHMPRGRSRGGGIGGGGIGGGGIGGGGIGGGGIGGGGGVAERDLTSKLQSQSHFPARQTPHRLSMLPRQQEFHQFKESYSEDLGGRDMLSHPNSVHYQTSSDGRRRNNWSVDNLYNAQQSHAPHFATSQKYVSYDDEERRPLAFRPTPIHRTNLATQV